MRKEYEIRIKSALLNRKWFTLVDALENVTDFWFYGKDYHTLPDIAMYIPNKHTLINRPSMIDNDENELGFRFNMTRMSPY